MMVFTRSRAGMVTAMALLGFSLSANAAIEVVDPPVPDMSAECFEDLSHQYGNYKGNKGSFANQGTDDGSHSFEHASGFKLKDKPRVTGDTYNASLWHYEPKGSMFGHGSDYDYAEYCTPVPEPQTWALMMLGLAGVVVVSRRNGRPSTEPAEPSAA